MALRLQRNMDILFVKAVLLISLLQCIEAYVFSCEEVKFKLLNTKLEFNTTYMCVFTQEGFSNWSQLKSIKFNSNTRSLYDIRNGCYTQADVNNGWKLTADASLKLNCNQEFTVIFSSVSRFDGDYILPLKKEAHYTMSSPAEQSSTRTIVTPQSKMWIQTESCAGAGSVSLSTGAGVSEGEQRYALRTWPCSALPRVIYSFDDVVTLTVDTGVTYRFSTSSNMGSSSRPPISKVTRGDYLAVLTSGHSNDVQNLKGNTDSRAYINIDRKEDVTVVLDVTLDPVNTGSVQLQKRRGGTTTKYTSGTKTEKFSTDYLEVRYEPSALQPQSIWRSLDNVLIDVYIGVNPPPTQPTTTTTTAAPTTTTTTPTTTTTTPTEAVTTTTQRTVEACRLCSQKLIAITADGVGAHAFQSDVIDLRGACAVRTMTCTGANANIELNDGLGIVDDGPDGVARLILQCSEDGTAWLDAGVPITQVECASG
ncbi:hypothetical protein PRIPAC_81935 [Pristionchus pacificus]|uniref:Uncharacterized protein n=1 Tax=Pristionchus pacificus TaxID=54126 RepID=A0A2A6CKI8_PRIPA|nr:hypothetical protein PRIPAC_81935 [Pristionchus pacificus]|eukprot:PDM78541.1 hypothetical protein PRIPAC_31120 [Pristionchus pacificus]